MEITFKNVASSNGKLYGLDAAGKVWVMTDGNNWERVQMPKSDQALDFDFV